VDTNADRAGCAAHADGGACAWRYDGDSARLTRSLCATERFGDAFVNHAFLHRTPDRYDIPLPGTDNSDAPPLALGADRRITRRALLRPLGAGIIRPILTPFRRIDGNNLVSPTSGVLIRTPRLNGILPLRLLEPIFRTCAARAEAGGLVVRRVGGSAGVRSFFMRVFVFCFAVGGCI